MGNTRHTPTHETPPPTGGFVPMSPGDYERWKSQHGVGAQPSIQEFTEVSVEDFEAQLTRQGSLPGRGRHTVKQVPQPQSAAPFRRPDFRRSVPTQGLAPSQGFEILSPDSRAPRDDDQEERKHFFTRKKLFVVALAGLAFLGATKAIDGTHENPAVDTKATIAVPKSPPKAKASASPTPSPSITEVAPAAVPAFVPQSHCIDVATIGINSSVPVYWKSRLLGRNQNAVLNSPNLLTNLVGKTSIKWTVCLLATATPAGGGEAVSNYNIVRPDPTSMTTVNFNLNNAAMIATRFVDGSDKSTGVKRPDDKTMLKVFNLQDPGSAPDDTTFFSQLFELNKYKIQETHMVDVMQDSYTQNEQALRDDATAALIADINQDAAHLGIPLDKFIAAPTPDSKLPNGAAAFAAANPLPNETDAYNLRIDLAATTYTYNRNDQTTNGG